MILWHRVGRQGGSLLTVSSVARPDYAAHVRAVRSTFPEVVAALREILGLKLCAYLGSVKEARAVNEWAEGVREPSDAVQRRLRLALQVAGRSLRSTVPRSPGLGSKG